MSRITQSARCLVHTWTLVTLFKTFLYYSLFVLDSVSVDANCCTFDYSRSIMGSGTTLNATLVYTAQSSSICLWKHSGITNLYYFSNLRLCCSSIVFIDLIVWFCWLLGTLVGLTSGIVQREVLFWRGAWIIKSIETQIHESNLLLIDFLLNHRLMDHYKLQNSVTVLWLPPNGFSVH